MRARNNSWWFAVAVAVALWALPGTAAAQDPSAAEAATAAEAEEEAAAAAITECAAAAGAKDRARMEAAASRAEAAASSLTGAREADGLELRARVLTGCRLPFAGFMAQGRLIGEANALLERALALEPGHLGARYMLGMNHYHTPAFLGRTGDAVAALERVVRDHPASSDRRVGLAHYYLADLYARTGRRADAARTWREGARRFPDLEADAARRFPEVASLGRAEAAAAAEAAPPPPADPGGVAPAAPPPPADPGVVDPPVPAPGPAPTPAAPDYRLDPIVVEAGGYSMEDPRTATRLSKLEVYTMPGGTADVLQVFQTMPGVTRVTDGGDLYVRGGDPAEAPMYVDGARLFYPGRFETLNGSVFGVLDPSVMRRAYFSSGGFSARYGNALSGIVDIETEGRPSEARWRGGLNLASLGGTVWQPVGQRAGVWGTGMLTRTDAMLALHGRSDQYPEAPRSAQAMTGFVVEPRPGLEVRATALVVTDETTARVSSHGYDGEFRSGAASRLATASARWLREDGRAGARLALGASLRESAFEFGVLDREREDGSLGARLDGDLTRGPVQLRAGLEAASLASVREGAVPAGEELAPGSPVWVLDRETNGAGHLGGYVEVETRATRRLALIAGLRSDALPGEDGWAVDPRLAAAYRLDGWTLRVGAGGFSQGRWRTAPDVPDGGRPGGVPLRARHLVAGVQREGGALALRAEAYAKDYDDYVGADDDAPSIVDGRARGVDVLARWSGLDRVTGWLTYSYLDGVVWLEDGTRIRSAYDVTHTATGVGKLTVGDAWEVGLTGRYGTGRPYTPILGAAEPAPDRPIAPVYGAPHSERLPAYFRLDGRLTRLAPVRGGVLVLYLEALNLLDHPNVLGYTYDGGYGNPRPIRSFFAERTLVFGVEAQF